MAIESGKKFYFMTHAYHHILGEVVEVTGRLSAVLRNVVRVQSCARDWSSFFAEGCKQDTTLTYWPDGTEVNGWFIAVPWNHAIPTPETGNAIRSRR